MDAESLLRHALAIASSADVTTPRDRLVLFTVSYQPTRENKDLALRFLAENPGHVIMDDTEAGRLLEALDLSGPASPLTREQAYDPWFVASRRLIYQASGNVTAFVANADPRSTFVRIELPALLDNDTVLTVNGTPKFAWAALSGLETATP